MVEIFEHPLFLGLVGLTFSVGFGPWLARRWQDHQRDREVRTNLVTDMSRCIMNLVAILEKHHRVSERKLVDNESPTVNQACDANPVDNQSRTANQVPDEIAQSAATFHVDRCVIGTKLETYFLNTGNKVSLAKRWTTFADELIRFSNRPTSGNAAPADSERQKIAARLNQKTEGADKAAIMRSDWVDGSWGRTEQLFLSAKRDLLEAVRKEPMVRSARPPMTFAMWLLWFFVILIAACVAMIGVDLATTETQQNAFKLARVAIVALAIILLVIGLVVSLIRRHRQKAVVDPEGFEPEAL